MCACVSAGWACGRVCLSLIRISFPLRITSVNVRRVAVASNVVYANVNSSLVRSTSVNITTPQNKLL